MPSDLKLGADSLDLLIDCCTGGIQKYNGSRSLVLEFVNLLSSESNDVSTREKKNTIYPGHVLTALEELGFGEFVPEVREAWNSWQEENKHKSCTFLLS